MNLELHKIFRILTSFCGIFFIFTSFTISNHLGQINFEPIFALDASKAIVIEIDTQLVLNNFSKTFNSKYYHKRYFYYEYGLLLAEKLKNTKAFSEIYIHLKAYQDSNRFMKLDPFELIHVDSNKVFNNAVILLKISNFTFDKNYGANFSVIMPFNSVGVGISESFAINNNVQLCNNSKNFVIIEYDNKTDGPIDFKGYNSALEYAMHLSTNNIVKLINKQKGKL